MHIDNHRSHQRAAYPDEHNSRHAGPLPNPVTNGQDRVQHGQNDTAKRNNASNGKFDQENDKQQYKDERLQR